LLKVSNVFIFLCEDVGIVQMSCNVLSFDKIFLNLFSDSVFPNLNVSNTFCCHVVCPLNANCVVLVDDDRTVGVELEKFEVFQDVCYLLECFYAFVH